MELYFKTPLEDYLHKTGWKLHPPDKIRGFRPDMIIEKDGKLAVVQVHGGRADFGNGVKKVLHYKNAANYAYLAVPDKIITDKVYSVCKSLGIGLISLDDEIREIIRPKETRALESVKTRILKKPPTKKKPVIKKSMLEVLFRSRSMIQILKFLFLNQTGEYYLHELARGTHVSAPTVLRELDKIHILNLVTKTRRGRATHYGINRDCTIFEELKKIFLKFELAEKIISEGLAKLDIKYALIFGSFARGTETEGSDMDLLIIGSVERDLILRSVSELEDEIGREINFILWTEKEFREKSEQKISLLRNIADNEIVMITGDKDEFTGIVG